MIQLLPKTLVELIDALGSLPGVGPRTAERYASYLLRTHPSKAKNLSETLSKLHDGIKICPKTFAFIDAKDDISPLYSDAKRDKTVIAIVADPFDIVAVEKTGMFAGTYHVLGGLISPIDGVLAEDLRLGELVSRTKEDKVKEIILATNASVEGETTALYIQNALKEVDVKISRLARGLPIGVDLEYADQITLGRALEGRQTV